MIYGIYDNFLPHPHLDRKQIIEAHQTWCDDKSEWHANDVSTGDLHDMRTLHKLELLLPGYELQNKQKLFNWAIKNPHDAVHIHWDEDDVIGVVYLNPEYRDDYTLLLRHKETGVIHKDQHDFGSTDTAYNLDNRLFNDEFNLSKWETLAKVECKFNRLLLFCPQYYHTASRTFGTDLASSRLVQVFHFKKEKNNADSKKV